MSSRSLGTLSVDIVAKIGGFTKGMTQAEREAQKTSKAIERRLMQMGAGVEKSMKVAGAAALASFAVIGAGVKNAIDAADALGKMSQRTGVSVEALSRLEVAASQSDTSLETLQKGLINLGRAQLEARRGTEEQVALFKALGISAEDLDRLSPDQVLKRIADAFQNTADSPEKAAIAVKAFGKAGAELIPFLNGGSEQLERFDRLSDELGNTMSQETALAAAELNDQLDLVKTGINGVWRDTATGLLPTLNELAGELNDPRFREGFAAIVAGAVEATATVARLVTELGNLTRWAGEEVAARIAGPSRDDIVRLEQQRDRLQEELDGIVIDVPAMFNVLGLGRRDTLKAELRETETMIAEYYATLEQLRSEAAQSALEAPEEATAAGLDLDAWRKEAEARAAAAAAAAAARKADVEAREASLDLARREEAELEAQAKLNEKVYEQQAELRRLANEERQERESALEAGRQLLADLEFELELMKMSNAERATAIQLRGLDAEAVRKYGDAIRQANEEIEAQIEQIRGQDFFRGELKGLFTDVVSGAESAKDAIDSFFDNLRLRAIEALAENLINQLFGKTGTTDGGMAGDGWASWLGSLFGGARADGGPVSAGKAYLVGEEGPELFRPRGAGQIVPAAQTAAMAGAQRGGDMTVVIQGATSGRSIERIRIERDRAQRRAVRELG